MSDQRRLTEREINASLSELPGWTLERDHLHRNLKFESFVKAFSFMSGVALIAEKLNHHPDWSNVYGTVVINLSTHDLGGVSPLDIEFASRINDLLP